MVSRYFEVICNITMLFLDRTGRTNALIHCIYCIIYIHDVCSKCFKLLNLLHSIHQTLHSDVSEYISDRQSIIVWVMIFDVFNVEFCWVCVNTAPITGILSNITAQSQISIIVYVKYKMTCTKSILQYHFCVCFHQKDLHCFEDLIIKTLENCSILSIRKIVDALVIHPLIHGSMGITNKTNYWFIVYSPPPKKK